VPTYSAHWIREAGFRAAVERFLAEERAEMACEMEQLRELLPYRQA
jgi:predicted N-acyltransferase